MHKKTVAEVEEDLLAIPIIQEIVTKLKRDLSKDLVYHSASHTLEVLHEAVMLGVTDNLSERELHLLGVACAYHDAGFLKQRASNEEIGADIAKEAMMREGSYSSEEISLVGSMIIDTTFHRGERPLTTSASKLANYLLDADVANFGREDFFEKSLLVLQEVGIPGDHAFDKGQLEMLEQHSWYTDAAKALRQAQKEKNIAALRQKIANHP